MHDKITGIFENKDYVIKWMKFKLNLHDLWSVRQHSVDRCHSSIVDITVGVRDYFSRPPLSTTIWATFINANVTILDRKKPWTCPEVALKIFQIVFLDKMTATCWKRSFNGSISAKKKTCMVVLELHFLPTKNQIPVRKECLKE